MRTLDSFFFTLVLGFSCAVLAQDTNTADLSVLNRPPSTVAANIFTSMETLDDTQRLGPGDTVSYRVLEDKEEAKSIIITDAGELAVPYLGRVKASEKTCKQLAYEIKAALEKTLYYQATVIVAVDLLNKKRGTVYLFGQVRAPGALEIPSDETLTVSKAILRAGGFGEFANKKRVRVTRGVQGGPSNGGAENANTARALAAMEKGDGKTFIEIDVGEILEKGRIENDLLLGPGDLVFVPSRLINF